MIEKLIIILISVSKNYILIYTSFSYKDMRRLPFTQRGTVCKVLPLHRPSPKMILCMSQRSSLNVTLRMPQRNTMKFSKRVYNDRLDAKNIQEKKLEYFSDAMVSYNLNMKKRKSFKKDPGDVDVTGIDPDKLLEALWKRSKPAAFFKISGIPPPEFDLKRAKQELHHGYADYVCGRLIKTNIYNEDNVSSLLYDRDNGEGAFVNVVDQLKKSKC